LRALPRLELIKEHDLIPRLVSLASHVIQLDPLRVSELIEEHVIVSGKERPAIDTIYQILQHCMSDRVAIKGGGPPA
jgi:hypothetical protein